jgi:hypothetical protein
MSHFAISGAEMPAIKGVQKIFINQSSSFFG